MLNGENSLHPPATVGEEVAIAKHLPKTQAKLLLFVPRARLTGPPLQPTVLMDHAIVGEVPPGGGAGIREDESAPNPETNYHYGSTPGTRPPHPPPPKTGQSPSPSAKSATPDG